MKAVLLGIIIAITATLARADDMAEMISRYRREHGLSSVKIDAQLTAIAERQAKAMAASGTMDHSVAGSFASRISAVRTGAAAENIAAGTSSWAETLRLWKNSPGHNANLLQARADSIGVAVARNDNTRFKTFWALVIAEKAPKTVVAEKSTKSKAGKASKHAAQEKQEKVVERRERSANVENPLSAVKNFVCKYLCN